jgi:uncharacterized membrane protein YccC
MKRKLGAVANGCGPLTSWYFAFRCYAGLQGEKRRMSQIRNWFRINPSYFEHAVRNAIAAALSYAIPLWCRLPEPYWAPITAVVVIQSTLGAALSVSLQRFAGTLLGAIIGGLAASYFQAGVLVFGAVVLITGLVCAVLHLDRPAYRFAGITLAIVMLIPRIKAAWTVAFDRFLEVSVGIAVGLAIQAVWPPREPAAPQTPVSR